MLSRDFCLVQRVRSDPSFYQEQIAKILGANMQQIVIITPEVTDEEGYTQPRYTSLLQTHAPKCSPPHTDTSLLLELEAVGAPATAPPTPAPPPEKQEVLNRPWIALWSVGIIGPRWQGKMLGSR